MRSQIHILNEKLPKSSKGSTCIFTVRGIDKIVALDEMGLEPEIHVMGEHLLP